MTLLSPDAPYFLKCRDDEVMSASLFSSRLTYLDLGTVRGGR